MIVGRWAANKKANHIKLDSFLPRAPADLEARILHQRTHKHTFSDRLPARSFVFEEWNNPVLSVGNLAVLTDESCACLASSWGVLESLRWGSSCAV